MSSADFLAQWNEYKRRVNTALEQALPSDDSKLAQAMRYSCLQGGKRFRAGLVYASGAAFNTPLTQLDDGAAAIEMIHAYSLIHDDLPAMDDDAMRRGQPSCHKQFDEATAILAGDALQSMAFVQLSRNRPGVHPKRQLKMIRRLAMASGAGGMAGGQALDMQATGQTLSLEQLQQVHENKTGALIRAALSLGALAAKGASKADRLALDDYGRAIGLAFQVTDDILDETQTSAVLGKQSGADAALYKNTYPALIGLEPAQAFATHLHQQAQQALDKLADNAHNISFLRKLAQFAIGREY